MSVYKNDSALQISLIINLSTNANQTVQLFNKKTYIPYGIESFT